MDNILSNFDNVESFIIKLILSCIIALVFTLYIQWRDVKNNNHHFWE